MTLCSEAVPQLGKSDFCNECEDECEVQARIKESNSAMHSACFKGRAGLRGYGEVSKGWACSYCARGIRFESGLEEASPEQGLGPSAILLGDAVSNLMTQGQVHLISNLQGQAQGCQRVGLSDSYLASPGQCKLCTPLRDLG